MKSIRNLIYLYFLLWVIEGALRRWIFPGLATPLLVVRDPVVILIYIQAFSRGIFPDNGYIRISFVLTGIAFVFALLFGHGNIATALFGVRVFFLHLPLMFIIGKVLTIEDFYKVGYVTLLICAPMSFLMYLQYQSPPNAWVNVGIGGEGSSAFSGAMGRNRPPGTWTFISGPVIFYTISTAVWFAMFYLKKAPVWLLAISAGAILFACPISISRSMLLSVLLVCTVGLFSLLKQGRITPSIIVRAFVLLGLVAYFGVRQTEFQEASVVFESRWDTSTVNAGGFQKTIVERFFSGLIDPLANTFEAPVFGYGLGLGTQAGAKLMTGERGFNLGEDEWSRMINELGPLIGLSMIALRFSIFLGLFQLAFSQWQRKNTLAMIMFAAAGLPILNGQWGQATILGGAIIAASLAIVLAKFQTKQIA